MRGLATHLQNDRCLIEVFAAEDSHKDLDLLDWKGVRLKRLAIKGPRNFKYMPALKAELEIARLDLLHTHGLWMYPSIASAWWARRQRKPLVVSAHGMLDSWAIKNSRAKKALAGILYENGHLRQARCLHALSDAEARAFRSYGLRNPICVIPNGLTLPKTRSEVLPSWDSSLPKGAKVLLYLGRIHPKKGLRALLLALHQGIVARSVEQSWFLVIAGWDQEGHLAELKSLSHQLDLERHVRFVGPQFGEDKKASFERADAFVLPSLSEGLPMVVLEAWSYELPVLMTPYCNLPLGFSAGAAINIGFRSDGILEALRAISALSDLDRLQMGRLGHSLVAEMFAWDKVASNMREMYEWAAGGGPIPSSLWQ